MRRIIFNAIKLFATTMMDNSGMLVNFLRRRVLTSTPQYGTTGQPYGQPGYQQQSYENPQYGQPPPYGQPAGMPQTAQPGAQAQGQWMMRPQGIPGCPPGLEYLMQIDQLLVKQQVELLEVFTGWETANKYKIKNSMDQQVYFASEESDMCSRQCCGPQRGFVIHITDNMNQEVIRVTREFKCCAGCCWCASVDCCAHEITVEAPVGQVVGYVKQSQSCIEPRYSIMNAEHTEVLNIEGPICVCSMPCIGDREFKVYSQDCQHEVGKISKQWSGLMREMFTDADNFGVSFPMDLDVKIKAVMIGAVFLIDFMFFEKKQNNNNNRH